MKYRWERSGNLRTTTWLQREAMDRLMRRVAGMGERSRDSCGGLESGGSWKRVSCEIEKMRGLFTPDLDSWFSSFIREKLRFAKKQSYSTFLYSINIFCRYKGIAP
jgi:hypothetical protein